MAHIRAPGRIALLPVLALALLPATPSNAAYPGRNGLIAFTSNRTGHYQVFTMRPDGSHVRRLTSCGFCSDPSFSANGRRIAYDDGKDVFVMRADGTHVRRITHSAAGVVADRPVFAPRGHRLAYTADPEGPGANQIFVIDLDGSHERALTESNQDSESPSFAPDGKHIVFVRPSAGSHAFDVFVMRSDGSHVRQLTHGSADAEDPSFSPSGRRIIFSRGFNTNIFVMRANGTHLRRITHASGSEEDLAPVFSPDGRRIAFQLGHFGAPEGTAQIATMDVDGTHRHKLTHTGHRAVNIGPPSWQPLKKRAGG